METRNVLISFLLVGLFSFAFISFATTFGEENNADINVLNDSRIESIYSGINDTIFNYEGRGIYEEANQSINTFNEESDSILDAVSDFLIGSVTFVAETIMSVGNAIFIDVWEPLLKAFGFPRAVRIILGTVISTILLFTITLLAWKLYKQGS